MNDYCKNAYGRGGDSGGTIRCCTQELRRWKLSYAGRKTCMPRTIKKTVRGGCTGGTGRVVRKKKNNRNKRNQ